jgi:single-stranded DNA-binding protein
MPETYATARIRGKLKEQPVATFVPAAKQYVARSALVTSRCEIPVVATGDLAERLSEYRTGTALEASGQIVLHQWKTGDGKEREQFEIELESVKLHGD